MGALPLGSFAVSFGSRSRTRVLERIAARFGQILCLNLRGYASRMGNNRGAGIVCYEVAF